MFVDNYLAYSIIFSILIIATGTQTPPKAKPQLGISPNPASLQNPPT